MILTHTHLHHNSSSDPTDPQRTEKNQSNSDLNKVPLRHDAEGNNLYWTETTYRLCLDVSTQIHGFTLCMSMCSEYMLMCMIYVIKNIFWG